MASNADQRRDQIVNRPRRQTKGALPSIRRAGRGRARHARSIAANRRRTATRLQQVGVCEKAKVMPPTDPGLRAFLEGIAEMAADAVLRKISESKGS